jgi:hypothetical protein
LNAATWAAILACSWAIAARISGGAKLIVGSAIAANVGGAR